MTTQRLEAFSDGVLAIVITIMVLELKIPESAEVEVLRSVAPEFLAYILSFFILGIYWNNHHHMLHITQGVSGGVMWANLHLLFWLSLVPATTAWVGDHPSSEWPAAVYGLVLLGASIAYSILLHAILRIEEPNSLLARAIGSDVKGNVSTLLYAVAVPLAFVHPYIAFAIYLGVALMWLVPDKRIERRLENNETQEGASNAQP